MKLKHKRIVWASFAVVLLIGGAIVAILQQRMNREVDAILAAATAAGEPTSIDGLARWHHSFASTGNSAAAFDRAFNKLHVYPPTVAIVRALAPLPTPPHRRHAEPEFALDEPLPESDLQSHRIFVRMNGAFFEKIEEVTNSPYAVFDLAWEKGVDLPLPHLANARKSALALAARCYLNTVEGTAGDAVGDIILMFRISSSLAVEPNLIAQLVRIGIRAHAHMALNRLLCHSELSRNELAALAATIRETSPMNAIVTGLIGARAIGLRAFEKHNSLVAPPAHGTFAWQKKRLFYLKAVTELIDAAKTPPPQSLDKVALAEQRYTPEVKLSNQWLIRMWQDYRIRTAISPKLLLHVWPAVQRGLEAITADRLALAAIAVERYRLEHERLPATLADVVNFMPAEDLIDPFTGKQLIYKTNNVGSAYAIYSVGKDRKNDGGPRLNADEPNLSPKTEDSAFPVTLKRRQR